MTIRTLICCAVGATAVALAREHLGFGELAVLGSSVILIALIGIFTIPGVRPNGPPPRHRAR